MLCFDHVSFRYPSQQSTALQEVDFAVEKGAYVVLLGANGSGKSTLARLANGLLVPDAGAVCVDGTSTAVHETLRELRSNVGVVSQDPDNQIVSTTVLDDVAFGPENLGLPPAVIAERCAAALALVGLSGFDERDPNTLSGGEKQRLVIAGVLAMEPSYLVLDEPCSMLDAMGRSEVRAAIAALRARGHGILHITHDLDETLSASKVLVLEKGKLVFSGSPDELLAEGALLERCGIGPTPPPLAPTPPPAQAPPQAPAQGSPAQGSPAQATPQAPAQGSLAQATPTPPPAPPPASARPLLLSNVGYTYAAGSSFAHEALAGIDLGVTAGSYTLITGHTGSGKSTLLRIAAGLLKPSAGTATLGSKPIEPGEVGLVFQQPESQLFAATVAEDVVFGPANLGRADTQEQREQIVRTSLEAVGLDPALFGPRSPFTLSGGEARRVALATILAMQPQMLLFDEPTAGLDRNGRIFFHQLVALQLASGTGVVVVSHDTDEFLPRVHSVLTLKEGRVIKADGSATVTISPCLQALPSGEGCICR